jgi:hypothetical protein
MDNIPKYDPNDLAADIVVKHLQLLDADVVKDITTAIKEAYGDGYCRGFNDATELKDNNHLQWWEYQDNDQKYLEDMNEAIENDIEEYQKMSAEIEAEIQALSDRLDNDDEVYGDIPNIPHDMLPPGTPFDRSKKGE